MIYDENVYAKIKEEYDRMRAQAEKESVRRAQEVYKKIPRLGQIRDEINAAGLANIGNILKKAQRNGKIESVGEVISSLPDINYEEKILSLEAEKREILLKNNIPQDFEKPVYNCSICSDTGYDGNKKCRCFEQKLITEMYSISNFDKVLREQNFDTFDFKYFSPDKINDGESELEHMKVIYDICMKYCKDFDSTDHSLLFFGSTGTGKTFMSSCIAKYLIDKGKTVVYMRAAKLFNMYEDYRFGRSDEMTEMLKRIQNADFLIIDDLGTEIQNKSSAPFFMELLNERLQNGKKMLISTNYSMKELSQMYTERFTSRIYDYFRPYHFKCEDIRVKKYKSMYNMI